MYYKALCFYLCNGMDLFFLRGVAINIQSIPSTFEPPGWIRRLVFEFSQRRMGDPKKVLEI